MVEIYLLSDPRDGAVRYIGKAQCAKKRLVGHIRDAYRRKTPVYAWIRELSEAGHKPILAVIETCEEPLWPERERALISEARGNGNVLLNVAPGGNQPYCPIETRRTNGAKIAAARASNPKAQRLWYLKRMLSDMLRRGHVSDATKAKMRLRPDVFGGMANL